MKLHNITSVSQVPCHSDHSCVSEQQHGKASWPQTFQKLMCKLCP